ncbi:enoyl-CoA hydratase-related protein [Ornithinibacillus californiensis]|uniref:enoyl-CoA hydratase-related protein n=1 Tax=Ornithinibacillus californiensis TaxID=161536 RepID=UPI00064DC8A4|nr:enoyl-CoA hydratase-related protein [Ornithinibacillus californiensis]
METILFQIKNNIAYITLNRPEALNAFNYQMLTELHEKVNQIHLDRSIRAVIITGSGEKSFSAGADLKERKTLSEPEVRRNVKAIRDCFDAIANLPQPTIAAINGYCFGGGFELMIACDFTIAVKDAKMGLTETSWAIIPGAGGTQRLPRLIGEMRAKELILAAKKISAQEAKELGLILKVVDKESLLDECEDFAHLILRNGPIAITQAKYAISLGMNTDLNTGLDIEAKAYEFTIPTEDRLEALQAFSEKRAPNFQGK